MSIPSMATTISTKSSALAAALSPPTVGGAPDVAKTGATVMPGNLTIEELVQWLGMQLNTTDEALRTQMTAMTSSKDRLAKLGEVKVDIDQLRSDGGKNEKDGVTYRDMGSYYSYEARIPDAKLAALSPELRKQYEDMMASSHPCLDKSDPDHAVDTGRREVSDTQLKAFSEAIQNEMTGLSSSNETRLMTLQSAVSARSQMVEMISAMIKKSTDTASAIVGNMR